jgi:hypothetical protein
MSDDFGNFMDSSHNDRVGNTLTVNGRILGTFPVRAGEHVRLLLINAAKARIFGLEFQDHQPAVIALDGQPVEPHEPAGGRLVLGPAMRADLVIDMRGKPASGSQPPIRSTAAFEYRLLDLLYDGAPPLREHPLDAPVRVAANSMPELDLRAAERYEVTFGGGMMGRMMDSGGMMRGTQHSGIWSINGVAATGRSWSPF